MNVKATNALETAMLAAQRCLALYRRYSAKPASFTRQKTALYDAYWRHAAARLGARVEDRGGGLLRIALGSRVAYVRYHHIGVDSYLTKALVDDKDFIARLVQAFGFRSPRSIAYTLADLERAHAFLHESAQPCVVKPLGESGGRGITTGIRTRAQLLEASAAASGSLSLPRLLLEAQHPGECFRLLYLDGELLHAVRRGRPAVRGDGRSSIGELIRRENERRLADPSIRSISPLTIDLELRYTLAAQGLSLRSVPGAEQRVVVKNACNENSRDEQADVTRRVHPAYQKLAQGLLAELGAHLVGIDVMSEDIGRSPDDSGSVILEANIPPGLHYHELVSGAQRSAQFSDVGARVLDYALGAAHARRQAA